MTRILCIGGGYVGGPTMAVIASKCPEYHVTVTDRDEEKIRAWNSDTIPIYEPGLEELVKAQRGKNLFYSADMGKEIREADIIFVSVNTPSKTSGPGAGRAADLRNVEQTARLIAECTDTGKIVVEKSTVPVRTAQAIRRILEQHGKGLEFSVVSNPEFLSEGTAVRNLLSPDRVLIGGENTSSGRRGVKALVELYAHWVPREKIITTSLWSSELTKLVANALLAQRISSINSISALCEATGADVTEVARAAGMDKRIGGAFLEAGIGFGGSCFKKDLLNLVYLCEYYGLPEVAEYWDQVLKINFFQARRFVQKILDALQGGAAGKRFALFGYAFKADTGDTRETPARTVAELLLQEGALLSVHDPEALENAKRELPADHVSFHTSPYKAAEGAHALLILTPWEEFRTLDYRRILRAMEKPALLFDGRNLPDPDEMFAIGFDVYPIGKAARVHFPGKNPQKIALE